MRLKLIDKIQEVPNVYTFIFKPECPLKWQAGQFLQYTLPHENPDERGVKRYFTIASASHEKSVMLTTRMNPKKSSSFKTALINLEIGQVVEANGPNGSFIIEDPQKQYVFIAGGIGITPFRAIVLDLAYKNLLINATLLYGNRDNNIVFKDIFGAIPKKHAEFRIEYLIDPKRISEQTIKKSILDLKTPLFYVSGPKPMVQNVEKMLADMSIPEKNVKRDYFPGYEDF